MVVSDDGGGGKPLLKKPLDPSWVEAHPEWRPVYDCDRYGSDQSAGWTFFMLKEGVECNLDMHMWCVENCLGIFYAYSDLGVVGHFAFKNKRDAALFKLFFAETITDPDF